MPLADLTDRPPDDGSDGQPKRLHMYMDAPEAKKDDSVVEDASKPSDSIIGAALDRIVGRLTGTNGYERYQTWPEKMVREAVSAPHDAMTGQLPMNAVDPLTGEVHTSSQAIEGAQAIAGMAGTGGLSSMTDATLGSTPFLRPALKYGDKIYKAPVNGQHLDAIPPDIYPEFQRQAMSGEDISNFNFGFMNHKGQFLDRQKALDYAIENGLVDQNAGKYGALTSTMELKPSASDFTPALRDPANGQIYKGDSHPQAFSKVDDKDAFRRIYNHLDNQGFVDKSNQFLTRADFEKKYGIKNSVELKQGLTTQLLSDSGTPGMAIEAAAKANPFFSAVEHAVNNNSQPKMTGSQWLGTLSNKPGVKPEEMQWTGLNDFLKENGNTPVTREQVQEHLANNKVELKEINKGGEAGTKDAAFALAKEHGWKSWDEIDPQTQSKYMQRASKEAGENPTKYHSYQLPGGENYREMLLTLPTKATQDKIEFLKSKGYTEQDARSLASKDAGGDYKSSHWDEPNILAHVRMNDRTIDGKKSLHLEEIQSDWHQQGRRVGYKSNEDFRGQFKEAHDKFNDLENKLTVARSEVAEHQKRVLNKLGVNSYTEILANPEAKAKFKTLQSEDKAYQDAISRVKKITEEQNAINPASQEAELANKERVKVPQAPFKNTWHEMALKRMIREAAEKGYDRLSWTPGEAQAARYDLSKSVKKVYYDPELQGGTLAAEGLDGATVLDKQGIKPDQIGDYVGKDVAKKLLDTERNKDGIHSLEGIDLKVGGEGMKGFYDKMIPKAIEKISGQKVQTVNLETNPKGWKITPPEHTVSGKWMVKNNNYNSKGFHFDTKEEAEANLAQQIAGERSPKQSIHFIDIPQSLRDTAMHKGFPLFSGGLMFSPIDGDPTK